MAIVRFGGGISEMRGSIDGVVFSRTRAGAIARNRISPVQPNTSFQSAVRSQFAAAVGDWKSVLTGEQASGWSDFAQSLTRLNAIGETYVPAGRQLYLESAMNLNRISVATLSDAPIDKPEEPTLDISGASAVGTVTAGDLVTLDVTGLVPGPDCTHIISQATLPLPVTTRNLGRHYRELGAVVDGAAIDLIDQYEARFLDPTPAAVGQQIGIRLKGVNSANGFATSWYYLQAVLTAGV
jgi:hypothetical protein